MALPTLSLPIALMLHLLLAVDAGAQTSTDSHERRIVLSEHSAEAPPEIRVRPGVATLVRFVDATIVPESIALDDSRVNLFDKGARSLIVEPLVALGSKERLVLSVQFSDQQSPAKASFVLVPAAGVADDRVTVVRRGRSIESLEAALEEARTELVAKEAELQALRVRANATGPSGLALQGLLGENGVTARDADCRASAEGALRCAGTRAFRADTWAVVVVTVENTGSEPWAPVEALLTHALGGKSEKVRTVLMTPPILATGAKGRVVMETNPQPWLPGEVFRLELRGNTGGRRLLITQVKL